MFSSDLSSCSNLSHRNHRLYTVAFFIICPYLPFFSVVYHFRGLPPVAPLLSSPALLSLPPPGCFTSPSSVRALYVAWQSNKVGREFGERKRRRLIWLPTVGDDARASPGTLPPIPPTPPPPQHLTHLLPTVMEDHGAEIKPQGGATTKTDAF